MLAGIFLQNISSVGFLTFLENEYILIYVYDRYYVGCHVIFLSAMDIYHQRSPAADVSHLNSVQNFTKEDSNNEECKRVIMFKII
jgi:hypothetical protein